MPTSTNNPDPRSDPEPEIEVQKALNLLRAVMQRKKRTQLEMQKDLGWGRSSISQLMTGQKTLRLSQLLDMLFALEVQPARFFAELYGLNPPVEVVGLDKVVRLERQVRDLSTELEELSARFGHLEGLGQKVADLEAHLHSGGVSLR